MIIKSAGESYFQALDYIKKRKSGELKSIKTPWPKFNSVYMDGLEWGWINTLAGMSGSGKTAFLNSLETAFTDYNADQDIHTLNFNFEMSAYRLMSRKISKELKKSVKQLYSADRIYKDNITDQEIKYLESTFYHKLKKYKINFVENAGTVEQIEDTIVKFAEKIDLSNNPNTGLVITLDHSLLVINKSGEDERRTLIELMACFNKLKKRYLKITFIVLSQLNRQIETDNRRTNRTLHYPTKGDIFGSDALYQFSDAVIVLHRPEMLGIDHYGLDGWDTKNVIFCHHLKVREGEPIITRFKNDLRVNDFIEM